MDTSFYTSKTSQRLRAEGYAEGRRQIIVDILRLRDIVLSDVERERILSCEDVEQLKAWFSRAMNATTAADVFEER